MISSSLATDATNNDEIPDLHFDNFKEVLNILVNAFDEAMEHVVQ